MATAANQADYTEEHLRRLRLVRALIDVGGVSVAGARGVIDALGDSDRAPLDLLGDAQAAIAPRRRPDRDTPRWRDARARVEALIARRGWLIEPSSIAIDLVADALAACESLQVTEVVDALDAYADAADGIAGLEVRAMLDRPDPASRLELLVLGTVLGEALFSALRLLAHQHESVLSLRSVAGAPLEVDEVGRRPPAASPSDT